MSVGPIILVALGYISSAQSKINETTNQANKRLLDYCATHTYSLIRYKEIYMFLLIHSDGSYLS